MTTDYQQHLAVVFDGRRWYALTPLQAEMFAENRMLSYDMAVAERFAGRRPSTVRRWETP